MCSRGIPTPVTTLAWSALTNDYTTPVSVVDPKRNLQIDPETKAPRTDEYSIGVDRELPLGMTVGVAYVSKRGHEFVGWTDTGGDYRQETRLQPVQFIDPRRAMLGGRVYFGR